LTAESAITLLLGLAIQFSKTDGLLLPFVAASCEGRGFYTALKFAVNQLPSLFFDRRPVCFFRLATAPWGGGSSRER
jgi:hypothetical protein